MDADGKMVFFDWDICGYGYKAYDLAVIRHNASLGDWDPGLRIADSVLSGYESKRPLTDDERYSLPRVMS